MGRLQVKRNTITLQLIFMIRPPANIYVEKKKEWRDGGAKDVGLTIVKQSFSMCLGTSTLDFYHTGIWFNY